jgi:hypothetical protein
MKRRNRGVTQKTTPTKPWKAAAQAVRREAAEARQRAYDSVPIQDKIRLAGAKEKAKLAARGTK